MIQENYFNNDTKILKPEKILAGSGNNVARYKYIPCIHDVAYNDKCNYLAERCFLKNSMVLVHASSAAFASCFK